VVRTYTSDKEKKFVAYPGGPQPNPVLTKKGGLNRIVWNMRYPSLLGAPNVFIEGSYRGHKASPGKYTATLKAGPEEKTASFSILPHPGLQSTAAEYQAHHEFMTAIETSFNDIHKSVNQLAEARKQINDLMSLLENEAEVKDVKEAGKVLVKRMTEWDEKLVQRKSQSNDDIINFVNKLSADYIFLRGEMDNNIPTVTQGARDQLAALEAVWQPLKKEYTTFVDKDIADFNNLCRTKSIGKVSLPSSAK
jgi:5-bromo-4-chloroindolyl phosphate hydrolysis protein